MQTKKSASYVCQTQNRIWVDAARCPGALRSEYDCRENDESIATSSSQEVPTPASRSRTRSFSAGACPCSPSFVELQPQPHSVCSIPHLLPQQQSLPEPTSRDEQHELDDFGHPQRPGMETNNCPASTKTANVVLIVCRTMSGNMRFLRRWNSLRPHLVLLHRSTNTRSFDRLNGLRR